MSPHAHPAESDRAAPEERGVDLPAETQQMIREFAQALPRKSHYRVLGIAPGVTEAQVREAFFESSKRFHPDRYFRKRLGAYAGLLTEIYRRVVIAHEVLRDPKLRKEYDRSLAPTDSTRMPGGPSLRSRRGLRSQGSSLRRLEQQVRNGQGKAHARYEEALAERDRGDWVRAVSLLRLAMSFDPRQTRYPELLAELLPRANAEQAAALRSQAEKLLERGQRAEALPLLDEAFQLQPTSPSVAFQVAQLYLEVHQNEAKARELAACAQAHSRRRVCPCRGRATLPDWPHATRASPAGPRRPAIRSARECPVACRRPAACAGRRQSSRRG